MGTLNGSSDKPLEERAEAAYREHIGNGIGQAPDAWRQMFVAGYLAANAKQAQPHREPEYNRNTDFRLRPGGPYDFAGDK